VHDKVLARNPLIAQLPQAEKPKRLIPDSWIDLGQKSIRQRSCYCVEQNLTQVRQSEWRETVRKYLYCLPSYEEQFGTNIITVLVSVQTGTDFPIKPLDKLTPTELEERQEEAKNRAHRRHLLQTWTEKEITSLNRLQDGDMFRFSSSPLDEITYRQLYFAPHWYIPFQQTPTALIPQNKEARS
jgi:hypothetical protein